MSTSENCLWYFVPGNLLYAKRLTDHNFKVAFDNVECQIKANDHVVAVGKLKNSLYRIQEEEDRRRNLQEVQLQPSPPWSSRSSSRECRRD